MNSLARAAALLLGLAACGDGPHGDVERSDDPSTTVELLDAGAQVVECDQAPNGTPCGRPGADQHCLFGACLRNACGDGVKTAEEGCDDGNERDHDGCSARCRVERLPGCGNGRVEPGESCDDGNFADGDGCSSRCTPDMIDGTPDRDAGEGREDGGPRPVEDGGIDTAPTDSGAPTRDAGVDDRACATCRDANCRDFQGADLVAGCFSAIDGQFGASPTDPRFLQDCVDIVSCARTHHCAYDPGKQAAGCYCGSASIDACAATGPAADAPCVAAWQTGARSSVNAEVQARFTDLAYPSGWAYFLLDCDRTYCSSPAGGDCTH